VFTVIQTFIIRFATLFGIALTGANLDVDLTAPVAELKGDSVAVSVVVLSPISEDLVRILESGTRVELEFSCRLRHANGRRAPLPEINVTNSVQKNLSTEDYLIKRSRREIHASELSESSVLFRLETHPIWSVYQLRRGNYFLDVSVKLLPITIESTGQTFDLMALWNYIEPRNRSRSFSLRELKMRQVER
jgi:hypothetical protein